LQAIKAARKWEASWQKIAVAAELAPEIVIGCNNIAMYVFSYCYYC